MTDYKPWAVFWFLTSVALMLTLGTTINEYENLYRKTLTDVIDQAQHCYE